MDFFNQIVLAPGAFNKSSSIPRINLTKADLVGFRAPYLETGPGLWPVLKRNGYRYDTSETAAMSYWPQKTSFGLWNFPLGELPVRNRGRKVLSMDYNFYAMQSKASPETSPSKIREYEDEMVDTYLNYFWTNYTGNRAPLHIGHHFTQYQSGAYWRALKRFAAEICGKPEVKCVTYKTLADELDKLSPTTLNAYRRGEFERFAPRAENAFQIVKDTARVPATSDELKKHVCPPSL